MTTLGFNVFGVPVPKGSTRAFVVKGRAVITTANARTRPWEQAIRTAALDERGKALLITSGVTVRAEFLLPRPKAHYDKCGALKEKTARERHVKKPDLDKLVRALLDAITGTLILDDAQVVKIETEKRYVSIYESPGIAVEIETLESTTKGQEDGTAAQGDRS